jgi:CRP-like cAMP-binding protein
MGPKPGILILEDNYLTADTLSDLVRAYGYDVMATVGHVDSAFQFLEDNHVDGAIVDINLHGDTSFAVCHELKRRNVPFFFLSGYERSVLPVSLSEHRLLSKPVDFAHFRTALAEFGTARLARARLGNALLDALPPAAFAALEPRLERVGFRAGKVLQAAHQPTPYVHFPTDSLVSLVARDRRGRRLEIGQVGHDGVIGVAEALTGGASALTEAVVELSGGAWRVSTAELASLMRLHRDLQADLLRYVRQLMEEMAQTALATGHGTIEQRLARWLLTAASRSGRNRLEITHEQLSRLLAVRRSGITVALHMLEGSGAIKADRRMIEIADRAGLHRAANGFA